jgi:DNA-binding PadR family transcriptional regulator
VTVAHSVADVLSKHVGLELECIDRMYLNVYVPRLQYEKGISGFFRFHRGYKFASSALMKPMTDKFVADIEAYAKEHDIPVIIFEKGQRKDDVAKEHLARFKGKEGIVFIGKAQEKAKVHRTTKKKNPKTGQSYAWLVPSTAMVNHFYFYGVDEEFGPFFIKFCSYFPYTAKLYINGHEYLKRQLTAHGIGFEPLDNGILSCEDEKAMQGLADTLTPAKIDRLLRKWLKLLPHPFTAKDRAADYRYKLSILQAEFSLTQILDRPLSGQVFFEQVIRENLDIGRPDKVQLIFNRPVTRRTPGRRRTRVLTHGVIPTLHVDYKHGGAKQYLKPDEQKVIRGVRTENTINDARDFGLSRSLENLPKLKEIGFAANRRMLQVEQISHDCFVGEEDFQQLQSPVIRNAQRASALRFGDPRVMALLQVLVLFCFLPEGFRSRDLREHYACLLGIDPTTLKTGQMTYQLRRLLMHGLIERVPQTHRYRLTEHGLRAALFLTRLYARTIRPGMSFIHPKGLPSDHPLQRAFEDVDKQINELCEEEKLAA